MTMQEKTLKQRCDKEIVLCGFYIKTRPSPSPTEP